MQKNSKFVHDTHGSLHARHARQRWSRRHLALDGNGIFLPPVATVFFVDYCVYELSRSCRTSEIFCFRSFLAWPFRGVFNLGAVYADAGSGVVGCCLVWVPMRLNVRCSSRAWGKAFSSRNEQPFCKAKGNVPKCYSISYIVIVLRSLRKVCACTHKNRLETGLWTHNFRS